MGHKNGKPTTVLIGCMVSLGMFSSERIIEITLPDGRKISAFVDKQDVITEQEPTPAGPVRGQVRVSVVEEREDSVIIDLPQPSMTEGPRLIVPKTLLEQSVA